MISEDSESESSEGNSTSESEDEDEGKSKRTTRRAAALMASKADLQTSSLRSNLRRRDRLWFQLLLQKYLLRSRM